jgi:haloalkane dehalogenase
LWGVVIVEGHRLMQCLRTPEERFDALPDFDYPAHYADVPDGDGGLLRMAWVQAGPPAGPTVLCLHGEPSWSLLYRTMLPVLAAAGLNVICPDLVGFGRSDKPMLGSDHSYARHVEWVRSLAFDVLELSAVTLVGQDWGGLIGLRLVAEHPERFAGVVAANTGMPTGEHPMPDVWHKFRAAVQGARTLDVGRFVQSGCLKPLTPDVLAAYNAPFPDDSFTAGPRAMPGLVPITPDDPASAANIAAWQVLRGLELPLLVAFSDGDPITAAMAPVLQGLPGAQGRPHPVIRGAGHFLQEDAGPELADHIAAFVHGYA